MKIAGIIAEYNPFHKGHEYHIEKTREITGADYVIAVMSGDFVQRGECTILPAAKRARMALMGGADLVLELPVYYSLSSAEFFASGAVSVLNSLGCVDYLSFGCETPDTEALKNAARTLLEESPEYKSRLKELQRRGLSFPAARQNALSLQTGEKTAALLTTPNNILAIEYLKALIRSGSSIEPAAVERSFAAHDGDTVSEGYASALKIRSMIKSDSPGDVRDLVPEYSYKVLSETGEALFSSDFSLLLHARLLEGRGNGFEDIWGVPAHLSRRILSHINEYTGFQSFCDLIKTRNITRSAVSRALMSITLGLKKAEVQKCIISDYASYVKILGFRRNSKELLSAIKNTCSLPIISKPANAEKLLSEPVLSQFNNDVRCSSIYEAVFASKHGYTQTSVNPISQSPVIV